MSRDITGDRRIEDDENYEGADLELRDIPLPNTGNILYSILSSLNHNIANFYAYTKFRDYLSQNTLDLELLQRSMSIHRDFSACCYTQKKNWYLFIRSFWKKLKLLFKGEQVRIS